MHKRTPRQTNSRADLTQAYQAFAFLVADESMQKLCLIYYVSV
jgi:hypothetical protein